jgi:acyl-CoA synthetase (AMP-forming)/AMP-acid ligase II
MSSLRWNSLYSTNSSRMGVVYHHRGAYLNALGNILVWGMRQHPVYLWTLPMFHCNGSCFPWGAPVVMNMRLNAEPGLKRSLDRRIEMMTAGAAPPAAVIEGMEGLGFHITHVFCRAHLAHFKAPRAVIFGPLPKTSTGKIQKFMLRERARDNP